MDHGHRKEIEIDVTKSAASHMGRGIRTVLRDVLTNRALDINDVVDFGAGKLKNDPFVLTMGKTLCAVEFDRLDSNPVTRSNYALCQRHDGAFRRLTPAQFKDDERRYDLAMLVNVIATMPYESERASVMGLLHDKLRDGKFALVFWLRDDDRYAKLRAQGRECRDGVWLGEGRSYQTFYRYYSPIEIIGMMHDAGFVPFNRFYTETNHAFLFQSLTPAAPSTHDKSL
ncbi:MAG: hypothetical protein M1286_02215 [Candidatus Marsarchaeota archaeon]|nr:hypothetical protein [Candidatus Marsarchaeota archaeon]